MPTVEELLANKAKADEEFQELLEEVWKTEVEEKRRAEKAEEAEEKHLKEEHDKALAKKRVEEAEEKKRKAHEADEMQRKVEVEARKTESKGESLGRRNHGKSRENGGGTEALLVEGGHAPIHQRGVVVLEPESTMPKLWC